MWLSLKFRRIALEFTAVVSRSNYEQGVYDMKLDEIKEIAKRHNIRTGKFKKTELVRAIQQAEGNLPCFDNGIAAQCGQKGCLWQEDCA
jgi:hypothetical protein